MSRTEQVIRAVCVVFNGLLGLALTWSLFFAVIPLLVKSQNITQFSLAFAITIIMIIAIAINASSVVLHVQKLRRNG